MDSSKLKEFADDNFKFDENGRKLSKRVENTVGRGEIARYEQFLLFPQCFQKACFPGASKGVIVWELVKYIAPFITAVSFAASVDHNQAVQNKQPDLSSTQPTHLLTKATIRLQLHIVAIRSYFKTKKCRYTALHKLYFYHIILRSNDPQHKELLRTLLEKEKMRFNSIFSISNKCFPILLFQKQISFLQYLICHMQMLSIGCIGV